MYYYSIYKDIMIKESDNKFKVADYAEEPLISVIVPVYNVKDYLEECLQSILKQTYRNLEIILIDDGSTDGSLQICEEFAAKDKRIKLIRSAHEGVSAARNAGLENATGDYISFVDSDDFIDPDMYEYLFRVLKENDADISVCTYINEGGNRKVIPALYTGELHLFDRTEMLYALLEDNLVRSYLWARLYKRNLFDGVRFPVGLYYEDVATIFKVYYKAGKTVFSCVPKYHYRTRETSITGEYEPVRRYHYFLSFYERDKFMRDKGLDCRSSVKMFKRGIHEVSHLMLFPQTSQIEEIERDIIRKMKERRGVTYKQLGISMAVKRYFLYSHFGLYRSLYRGFRSVFRKKRLRY